MLALIGEGGMGEVYKVRDRELDRVIALKTVRSDSDEGMQAVQRFKQELLLARRITHKNVIRIHDLGESEGIKFFTMEFVEGESLKALIRRKKRLRPDEALALIRPVLEALREAHAQGVIHRDLKPQNVMVDRAGVPYLMDFGIARATDGTGMTATGAIVGTPDYMSPEQVRGEKAEIPSDIFAMGVILYEMLTGEVPYQGDSPVSKIMMRLTHKPRRLREYSLEIPKFLEQAVLKCMEVDPVLRYQSAGQVLQDLDQESVSRALTLRMQRAIVRRGPGIAAGVVVLVVAGGAIAYWRLRPSAAPPAVAVAPAAIRTLAVLPFTNASGAEAFEWLRSGLAEMLVTDLSQSKYVRPVPADRVLRVLDEAGLGRQARFDEKALESVAKQTHAQNVLSGQFVEAGGRLRLDLALRRSDTGVSVPLKVEVGSQEVFALVDQVSRRVKEQLDLSAEELQGDTDRPLAEVSTASLDAQRDFQAGLAAMRKAENQEAAASFGKATSADANFAMAFAKLAEASLNLGQDEAAAGAIGKAKTLAEAGSIPLAERYQIQATDALVREDPEAAAKSFGELAKLYPDDPDVLMSLARSEKDAGNLDGALAAYKRAAELAPGSGAALLGLGEVQVRAGDSDEAIVTLEKALATKQFDEVPEALGMLHSILGVAFRETGKLDKAAEELGLSLKVREQVGDKRGQASTLRNLGQLYGLRGEGKRAVDSLNKALALYRSLKNDNGESLVLNDLGEIYRDGGALDKAVAAFQDSLRVEQQRNDPVAMANRLDNIADAYRRKGQYSDALVYLGQARSLLEKTDDKKEKAINLEYLGMVQRAQGLYDKSRESLLAALPLYKEIKNEMSAALVQMSLADIYASQGRYADAHGSLQQALDIFTRLKADHDILDTRSAMGQLLVALGRVDEAEKEFDATSEHGHGEAPGILMGRARILELRGKQDAAAELYTKGNAQANLSGEKEIAVRSRIYLGRLYRAQGKLDNASRLLVRTRDEAAQAHLLPLQAEALAALAETQLAQGQAQAARRSAEEAVEIAKPLEARPTLSRAFAVLGAALEKLGQRDEAKAALENARSQLDAIRKDLPPGTEAAYMGLPEVKLLLAQGPAASGSSGGR